MRIVMMMTTVIFITTVGLKATYYLFTFCLLLLASVYDSWNVERSSDLSRYERGYAQERIQWSRSRRVSETGECKVECATRSHWFKEKKQLHNSFHSLKNSIGKYCSVAFIWMTTLYDLTHRYKVRTTLYSIMNSTKRKYCSLALSWMVILLDFTHQFPQQHKQHYSKVPLSSFHLNGRSFLSKTQTDYFKDIFAKIRRSF